MGKRTASRAGDAGTGGDAASAGEIDARLRLTVASFTDLRAALAALADERAAALERNDNDRAAVLAALAAQWIVSDFGSLTGLDHWAEGVAATPIDLDQLDDPAAMIYCAGVIALHQTQHGAGLPDPTVCLDHYRERLFAGHRHLDRNLAVATAEHPASWLANAGQATALEEFAALVDGLLDDARLEHRIRARWLLWMGANQMHADRREAAERMWAAARSRRSIRRSGRSGTWRQGLRRPHAHTLTKRRIPRPDRAQTWLADRRCCQSVVDRPGSGKWKRAQAHPQPEQ